MNKSNNKNLSKQYVILDDSGDPGVSSTSTSHFIIAAVIVVGENNKDKLSATVDQYRNELGWKETHEFKFNATKKSIIEELIKRTKHCDYSAYAIVLDKNKIPVTPDIIDSNSLYYYVIKELLLKLDLVEPYIIIDGIGGKRYMQVIKTYLRKSLKAVGVDNCDIKFANSKSDSLVQVADIIAGSIARSYRDDGEKADKFANLLEDKIQKIYDLEF